MKWHGFRGGHSDIYRQYYVKRDWFCVFLIGTLMNQYPNRLRVSDSPILHFKVHDSESHQMTFFRLPSVLTYITQLTNYTKQCVYVPDIETRAVETFNPPLELNLA